MRELSQANWLLVGNGAAELDCAHLGSGANVLPKFIWATTDDRAKTSPIYLPVDQM